MSGLEGNPYADAHQHRPGVTEDDSQWAIAQAVLALAHEQRTATLLSQHQYALNLHLSGEKSITAEELNKLNEQIEERMGLSDL